MKTNYYYFGPKWRFFIPFYGSNLWDRMSINQLLYSDIFHLKMKFYHNFLIPILWFSACIFIGRFLGIYFYLNS